MTVPAMIRINLLPTRQTRAQRRRRRTVTAGAAALCLAGVALAAVNVSQCRRQAALESGLTESRRVADGLRIETEVLKELEDQVLRRRRNNEAVKAWLRQRARHPRILRDLSAAAPERLWLTRYAESGGTTILEGRATDDESIARFLRSLSRVFKSAQLMQAGKAAGEEDLRRFVIHAGDAPAPDAAPPQSRKDG